MTMDDGVSTDLSALLERGDEAFDLAEAALMLAVRDTPATDLDPYLSHLKSLYASVEERAAN